VALLVAELLLTLVVALLVHLLRPLVRAPLVRLDRLLGVLPGAAKGLLLATLLLAPFSLFPLLPALSAAIERSAVASRLVAAARAERAVPDVAELMGPGLAEELVFLSPPQTEQGLRLPFGALGELAPDQDAEAQMLTLLNRERDAAGLTPLASDEALRRVARAHSLEMFRRGYFAHDSPDGLTPADRLLQAGIPFGLMGENLAYAPGVQVAHDGLMHSPGHRANILRPEFRRVGIGVIKSQLRGRMFSQEFADQPRFLAGGETAGASSVGGARWRVCARPRLRPAGHVGPP